MPKVHNSKNIFKNDNRTDVGITGKANNCIKSFLVDIYQRVWEGGGGGGNTAYRYRTSQ
jgi:hypothetical protein